MLSFNDYIHNQLMNSMLDATVKDFFLSQRHGIIYGAGDQSRLAIDFCHFFHKPVDCLLMSPGGKRTMPYWQEIPLYLADDALPQYVDRHADVILALHEKYHQEIITRLRSLGFSSIYAINNWNVINEELRNIWYNGYFSYYNFSSHTDNDGETYVSVAIQQRERERERERERI